MLLTLSLYGCPLIQIESVSEEAVLSDPLRRILEIMASHGATRFYAKRLAPNDNSKNQVYLGGGFGALNIIPHGSIADDTSEMAGSVRDRAKAPVDFYWIMEGELSPAPNAQLILYPKYPEVRMSGFLLGARNAPGKLMTSRDEGRVMFFGICPDRRVLCEVVSKGHPAVLLLDELSETLDQTGVFIDLAPIRLGGEDPRETLLAALKAIHQKGWISSRKIGRSGLPEPYSARNGGGYTLEAELGVSPNSYAEPDFLGWEVKQYGVNNFDTYRAKSPVTLMTPEPTGGYYREQGVEAFLRKYGYADKSGKADRINFGGVYSTQRSFHNDTGLALKLVGFDIKSGKVTDLNGCICLVDRDDNIAASWGFGGVMEHWNRKHAKAAYVPSLMQYPPPEYRFGPLVQLCEETDVLLLLAAFAAGNAYYDPGIKMEGVGSLRPKIKRRSQFRVKHTELKQLYLRHTNEVLE